MRVDLFACNTPSPKSGFPFLNFFPFRQKRLGRAANNTMLIICNNHARF